LKTHHRTDDEGHKKSTFSYKLKIVLFMVIIGISFLLYDTLSDRSIKQPPLIRKIPTKKEKDLK